MILCLFSLKKMEDGNNVTADYITYLVIYYIRRHPSAVYYGVFLFRILSLYMSVLTTYMKVLHSSKQFSDIVGHFIVFFHDISQTLSIHQNE